MSSEIFQVNLFAVVTTWQVERKGQLSTSVSFPDRSKIITDGWTKEVFPVNSQSLNAPTFCFVESINPEISSLVITL